MVKWYKLLKETIASSPWFHQ